MVEHSLAAQEDFVLHSLDYTLPKIASYVQERQEVQYFPAGDTFRPDGLRLIRIPITSDGFCDASSIVIEATIRNGSSTKLLNFSDSSFACLIQEVRLYMSGVEVERIQDYGRLVETLSRGVQMEKRINTLDIEFGISRDAAGKALEIGIDSETSQDTSILNTSK